MAGAEGEKEEQSLEGGEKMPAYKQSRVELKELTQVGYSKFIYRVTDNNRRTRRRRTRRRR